MYGIIATWRMALEGVNEAYKMLQNAVSSSDAIVEAIKAVEDFEYYKSVGYGGLPNEDKIVELDAGYMDGDTLDIGCVGAIKDIANPIMVARALSHQSVNNFLVGDGACKYAKENGFEHKEMLNERAKIHYHNRLLEQDQALKPYTGHDTVGMVCLDQYGHMTSATSTSGLFMKHAGRLGDSPVVGSGFYCDSKVGGASATGLGEDMMKGCISYEACRLMQEGMHPQQACEKAAFDLEKKLIERRHQAGDISLIAMNEKGEWGCATNIDNFSFVVATEKLEPTVYLAKRNGDKVEFEKASQDWMDAYMQKRMAPLERK